jgi:hypothetical protein
MDADAIALFNALVTVVIAAAAFVFTLVSWRQSDRESDKNGKAATREAQRKEAAAVQLRFQTDEKRVRWTFARSHLVAYSHTCAVFRWAHCAACF